MHEKIGNIANINIITEVGSTFIRAIVRYSLIYSLFLEAY